MNYIGIDIGGTNLKAGLVDEDGLLLAVKTMKIREVSDPDALTDTLVALTRELAQEGGVPMEEIASVGAGVPGVVDIRTGSIVYTCNLPLRNIPLRKLFKRRLGLHLYVENDANCAALAEYYAGAGQGSKRFVTITLGTGIGAGIIHNGKIFHGGNGMAGEVGHTCIDYQGLPCPCGRRGCWEQYASASALKRFTAQAQLGNPDSILARVIREHDGHVSGQSAFMAARLGDPVGQQVCDMYVGYLAAGIANVVNIFQPDTLAIGGGVSNESDEQLLHPLQQLVERETITGTSIPAAFPDGKDTYSIYGEETCRQLKEMMRNNVASQYGQAQFGDLAVCAKSGTAEVGGGQEPHAWFAGFIDDPEHPLAFLVLVENGGGGARVAGSIAAQVLAQATAE